MKDGQPSIGLLYITAAFAIFLIGFFAGNFYASSNRDGIRIVLQKEIETIPVSATETAQPSELSMPASELSLPAFESASGTADPTEPAESVPETSAPAETASALININTAGLEELKSLPGIGDAKANAILTYREEHGNFLSVEQITEVSGIGNGILSKIRDLITVE